VIQGQRFALVEDGEVMMRVAGQPDHVGHRQQRATSGQAFAGGGLERSVVVTMMDAGNPLC
jgi:hypothetical protein